MRLRTRPEREDAAQTLLSQFDGVENLRFRCSERLTCTAMAQDVQLRLTLCPQEEDIGIHLYEEVDSEHALLFGNDRDQKQPRFDSIHWHSHVSYVCRCTHEALLIFKIYPSE